MPTAPYWTMGGFFQARWLWHSEGLSAGQLHGPRCWQEKFRRNRGEGAVRGRRADAAFFRESFKGLKWREVKDPGEEAW